MKPRPWRRVLNLLVLVLGVVVLASCSGTGPQLVLYNGQHPQLTSIWAQSFSKSTHIAVNQLTNDGVVLADQLLREGKSSPADLYLTENSPELERLQESGLLATLPKSILSPVPSQFASPEGDWVGVAIRVSCLIYNTSRIEASQLPTTLLALEDPQWHGKVAIAPTDSDFLPLVGSLAYRYGRSKASSWLNSMAHSAKVYQDDEAVTLAVNSGQAPIGVVNQYYWFRLRAEIGPNRIRSAIASFSPGDPGNLENISGIAVLASSHNKARAIKFIHYLLSPKGQSELAAGDDFEYPAIPGIPANPAMPPLSSLPKTEISVTSLGDDQVAAQLLHQSGLA